MKATIVNPIIKDQVTFTETSASTGGRISRLEVTLMPGGGTPMHYHRNFSETFVVSEGVLTVTMNDRFVRLAPGGHFTVEKGVSHRFSNETNEPVLFTTIVEPGSTGFENALRILYGLAEDGITDNKGMPRNPLILAAISDMSDMHPAGAAMLFLPVFKLLGLISRISGTEKRLLSKYCQ
ncbi:cupin domain-containing protein [Chitinophaga caseinilytica]|uniref:Cupin domain-containing protein n=1 Tax=Chitinophaga caseinilytica TaxID=2267521 RepID=A0ABZ2Z0A4_9BACT